MTKIIVGIDEVGRGCLAGPVVAASVIIDEDFAREIGVTDSKKLTGGKRDILAQKITKNAVCWAVGMASVVEIDTLNIRQASLLAMRRSVAALVIQPTHALVDGRDEPGLSIPTSTVIQGDASEPSIASASIVAKVFRDMMMQVMAQEYPGYGLEKHMGYGTARHLEALDRLGVTATHRKSFRPVALRQTEDIRL